MHTPASPADIEDIPILGAIGTGRVWAFYPQRCHVESWLPVSPGMMVSLPLHLPDAARVKLENGLVTWARASEFGVQFLHGSTA